MTETFDIINAPNYVEFDDNVPEPDDTYFDDPLRVGKSLENQQVNDDPLRVDRSLENQQVNDDLLRADRSLENQQVVNDDANLEDYFEQYGMFRRSMSVGDLNYLKDWHHDYAKRRVDDGNKENNKNISNLKKTESIVSLDNYGTKRSNCTSLRTRSKGSLDRLAQPKRNFGSDRTLDINKYVSLAEAVRKFQSGTPIRFRSKPASQDFCSNGVVTKLKATVPHSPNLKSNARARPVNVLTHEEEEKREFEEAQKFKFKAHPLNKKILQGPIKAAVPIDKKPPTIPEPFKLTKIQPKSNKTPQKNDSHEFHARPVPDFKKPPFIKNPIHKNSTKPNTPSFMKRYTKKIELPQPASEPEKKQSTEKLSNTKPMPFSFEVRNQALQKKREDLLHRVYEDEKKAREFHARPAPKAILNPRYSSVSRPSTPSTSRSDSKLVSEANNISSEFKARPATVLYKKPFEPKKTDKNYTEIQEFQMRSDMRAREREVFEQQRKAKEEQWETLKQLQEKLRLEKENEEIMKLRKMTEYKAHPIRKYKEVHIQPSGKITEPISPKFLSGKRKTNSTPQVD